MTTVTIQHLRELKYCGRGSRAFFERHGMDWSRFLREGLPASEFEATGDAMAMRAVALAEQQQGGDRE